MRLLALALLSLPAHAAPTLPYDLNADGWVDGTDMGFLLANWGTYDGMDLGLLLASWGMGVVEYHPLYFGSEPVYFGGFTYTLYPEGHDPPYAFSPGPEYRPNGVSVNWQLMLGGMGWAVGDHYWLATNTTNGDVRTLTLVPMEATR